MGKITSNKISRISLIILLGLTFLTTSCKKDDASNSLSGTTWKYEYIANGEQDDITITFQQESYSLKEIDNYNGVIYANVLVTGTYTYDHPSVTLEGNGTESIGGTSFQFNAAGSVSGKQMTLVFKNSASSYVFTKQ